MKCNNCGGIIPDGSKFCMYCGCEARMDFSCSHCGFKAIPLEALFCPACGMRLTLKVDDYWDNLKIGDYYYSDGSFSTQLDQSKTCVGIVFSLETTAEEKKHGWTHGQIVALEDTGGEERCQWGPRGSLLTTHVGEWKDARKDKDGYLYSNTIYASGIKYEAFEEARKYSALLPSGKTSAWYLPSVGQWVDIIENLGQVSVLGESYGCFNGDRNWRSKLAFLKFSADIYWTSLQRGSSSAWSVSMGNGSVSANSKTSAGRVRPVSAI